MSGPAIVWLIVGLASTAAVLAFLIALIRHVFVLGRSLGRFQDEVAPLASAIAEQGGQAATRGARLSRERPSGGP